MPRGRLYVSGEQARRFTVRLQEVDWALFDREADEVYRDAAEHVQWLVNEQVRAWRRAAWLRLHKNATPDERYQYGLQEARE